VTEALPARPGVSSPPLTREEAGFARRDLTRRRLVALALVAPLLLFVAFAFFAPIASMLNRSVYNPTVSELIPDTLTRLADWSGGGLPDQSVLTAMAVDLKRLQNERNAGKLADEINRRLPGTSSVVKASARRLAQNSDEELAENGADLLLATHAKWADPQLWATIKVVGQVYTLNNFLTALDLEQTVSPDGKTHIQVRESAQIYIPLYIKTLRDALIITVLCIVLGYPLAYVIAGASPRTASILIILVLLPFWTSVLVRTTAWIALIQTNGVVNTLLLWSGLISEPLEMLYTELATVLIMTHILLPFMILPLYAAMKGIDPSYMKAAMSLGARPVPAFIRVYLPMTLPGLSAGALLVFIISVGYFIIPALVGGTEGQMISNLIAFHMQQSNNWELAAALGTLLLVLILILYWIYDRLVGVDKMKLG
jgi:putative spermidine/putrescine transport system permease protein